MLHLPDQVIVIDRKRETSKEYRYEFTVGRGLHRGLAREAASDPAAAAPRRDPAGPGAGRLRRGRRRGQGEVRRAATCSRSSPATSSTRPCTDPAAFYRRLRTANPAPYEFLFNLGEGEYLVGASPEMYVRVSGDRVETCPISGTIARGGNPVEDADAIRTLLVLASRRSPS